MATAPPSEPQMAVHCRFVAGEDTGAKTVRWQYCPEGPRNSQNAMPRLRLDSR
jgi:hypothetical protein